MRSELLLAGLLAWATGCIVEAPTGSSSASAPEQAAAPAREAQPLAFKNGANFDDKVELVAATVNPGQLIPGEAVRVALFFKVLQPVSQDYVIFVHVEDPEGRLERMNLDHRPAGGQRPTTAWKKGEVVRDEFALYLPPGVATRGINLWVGLWEPKSDVRMKLKNPSEARNDGANRVLAAQVPIGPR